MAFVRCECGCEVFYQVPLMKFDEGDFQVYGTAAIRATVGTISVALCVACNRMVPPNVSFPNRNRTDPEVKAYGEAYKAIQEHNRCLNKQTK